MALRQIGLLLEFVTDEIKTGQAENILRRTIPSEWSWYQKVGRFLVVG
jgi:hypothetical protein